MKKIFLSLLFLIFVAFVQAQNPTHPTVTKFKTYYTSNQADSIFLLFNAKMKEVVKLEGATMLVNQLKSGLGTIVKTRKVESPAPGVSEYRISFEKPIMDLALIIQEDSIAGIWQRPVEKKKGGSTDVASPDNFSVTNDYGTLYGTLVLPEVEGKVPVVLMIAGSGHTDRNMNQGAALKTNSSLLLAEALAEQGIASLRYDKRGVGKSAEALGSADVVLEDFIKDAELFIAELQSDVRFSDVIVLGHSEGSIIGSVASLESKATAFISLCGPASPMLDLIEFQIKGHISSDHLGIANEVLDSLRAGKTFNRNLPSALVPLFHPAVQPFLISANQYNPAAVVSKLNIPVLVVGGDNDIQVGVEEINLLAKAAKKGTVHTIYRMNHILKNAPSERSGNLATYNMPDLPLHPDLAPILIAFIKKVSKI